MTTSSSPGQRGLDAAPIVYSLLSGHPASAVCEGYIRSHSGWLTTTVTLLEADAVLRKVYGVAPALVAQKIAQFAAGPITVVAVDAAAAVSAMTTANSLGIDLADAVLLESCRAHGCPSSPPRTQNSPGSACGWDSRQRRRSTPRFVNKSPPGKPRICRQRVWRESCSTFTNGWPSKTHRWPRPFGIGPEREVICRDCSELHFRQFCGYALMLGRRQDFGALGIPHGELIHDVFRAAVRHLFASIGALPFRN